VRKKTAVTPLYRSDAQAARRRLISYYNGRLDQIAAISRALADERQGIQLQLSKLIEASKGRP